MAAIQPIRSATLYDNTALDAMVMQVRQAAPSILPPIATDSAGQWLKCP
jgi:hypothetical protein